MFRKTYLAYACIHFVYNIQRMILINYLLAILLFVVIYLAQRLVLFWMKKKPIWPLFDKDLLVDSITYLVLVIVLLGILHIIFRKIQTINLLWLDASLYILISIIKPHKIFFILKNKEQKNIKQKKYLLGGALGLILLLECFVFNASAYSGNKQTHSYQNFITEGITSNGEVKEKKIILKSKQYIEINTNNSDYDNLYLSFRNDDMNLYVNIFTKKADQTDYQFSTYYLINPSIDAFGYMPLKDMSDVQSLKIEFDIDSSRYLNMDSMPTIVVDKIEFDSYFPLIINPLRIGLLFGAFLLVINFKKLFISKEINEEQDFYKRIEKVILWGGLVLLVLFVISALIDNSAYFVKYDDLYLGGTSSNNIYYQQLDAYIKGQLHLDVPVDARLNELSNVYDPGQRGSIEYLWDHAFYNGKYYCYYGHAPIYLVMLPIYWISRFVPTNLYVLQLGVLFSIFAFLLAATQIFKLFIKKTNHTFAILTLISIAFGSLLLTNNTYEYGGMIYRIPYAYANGFLFLTIYLFLKGYYSKKYRPLFFSFAGLSLVNIVLSRPLELIYLLLFIPIIIKLIRDKERSTKEKLIDFLPAVGVVLVGAIFVCVMNQVRFGSILEFGEHYQLTVTDCTKNHLSIEGILGTIWHYFIKPAAYNSNSQMLSYRGGNTKFDIHPYITSSVGLFFIPVFLFVFIIPYVMDKKDDLSLILFVAISPAIIFFVAFINYCFAGVCPRYLNDIAPWGALLGGLLGMKAIEKDDGRHPVVPSLIAIVLILNIVLTGQYHFEEFDGLKIGDFNGVLGFIKLLRNQFNKI